MTPLQLHQKGFEALIAALGYVDAVRFIKQKVNKRFIILCPTANSHLQKPRKTFS